MRHACVYVDIISVTHSRKQTLKPVFDIDGHYGQRKDGKKAGKAPQNAQRCQ